MPDNVNEQRIESLAGQVDRVTEHGTILDRRKLAVMATASSPRNKIGDHSVTLDTTLANQLPRPLID